MTLDLDLDALQAMAEAAAKEQPTTEAETLIHGASVTILALIERVRTSEKERDEWRKRWEQEDENSRATREYAQAERERVRELEREVEETKKAAWGGT